MSEQTKVKSDWKQTKTISKDESESGVWSQTRVRLGVSTPKLSGGITHTHLVFLLPLDVIWGSFQTF